MRGLCHRESRGGGPDTQGERRAEVRLVRSRAFLEYYQEHLEYACPTEDIYLE